SPAAGPASPPTVLDTSPDGLTTRPIVLAEAPTTPMITVFAAPRPPDGDVPPAATDAPSADSQAPPSDSDAPPPPSTAPPAAPRSAPDAGFPSPESYLPMYLGWSGSSGLARQPAADREAHRTAPRGRGLLPAMLGRGGRRVSGPDETPTPGKGLSASADTLALPRGVTPPLPPLPAFPPPLSSPPDRAPRRPALSAALAAPSEEPAGGPDPAQPAPAPLSLMPPRPRPRPRHLRPEAADATTGPDATAGPRGTAVAVPPPSQAGGEGGLRAPTAGEMAAQALSAADAFVGRLAELPVRQASAYGTILRADLLFRMGREADANRALDVVESAGDVDDATLAHAALVRGDWAGYPDGGAQTLSRGWDGTPIPPARPAYRDRAEELWRRSLAAYGRVGSDSGRAAGLLRLADAPTAIGRPILRRARIDEAARRARSAGNDALTWTARLHSLIERARSGEASTAELATMMTALVEWSRFDGSTTFGGGLRCLLSAATGVPQPADDA
ncbi:hypothetical protein, partial [Frankia canadensis]|uniref:hypothetical protein n=1 Tax=Frankia canadensis TaxID=1836972 RepID=UPI001403EB79